MLGLRFNLENIVYTAAFAGTETACVMLRLVLCYSPSARERCDPHFTRAIVLAKLHYHL